MKLYEKKTGEKTDKFKFCKTWFFEDDVLITDYPNPDRVGEFDFYVDGEIRRTIKPSEYTYHTISDTLFELATELRIDRKNIRVVLNTVGD